VLAGVPTGCSTLPQMLRAFQDELSTYILFQGRVCCTVAALLEAPMVRLASRRSSLKDDASLESGSTTTEDAPRAKRLDDAEVQFVGMCCVQALGHLQRSHFLYRNLLPEHLLLLDNGYICFMDLRFAKLDEGNCHTLCGSTEFLSPEALRGEAQGPPCDWWALGVLLHELALGESPWGEDTDNDLELMKRIETHKDGDLSRRRGLVERAPQHFVPLLEQLLAPDASKRIGAPGGGGEAAQHTYFAGVQWDLLLESQLPSPLVIKAREILNYAIEEAGGDGDLGGVVEREHASAGETLELPEEEPGWLDLFEEG